MTPERGGTAEGAPCEVCSSGGAVGSDPSLQTAITSSLLLVLFPGMAVGNVLLVRVLLGGQAHDHRPDRTS